MSHQYPEAVLPPGVTITYIATEADCTYYAGKILSDAERNIDKWSAWAFDIEWTVEFKAGPQKPVGMMQFCKENIILLFHIAKCGIQPELAAVLQSPFIYKLGVNIIGDKLKIQRDFPHLTGPTSEGQPVNGCVDLRELATVATSSAASVASAGQLDGVIFTPIIPRSLAGLVESFLLVHLPKPTEVRLSNWDDTLCEEQKNYAAMDVFVSYQLYHHFMMNIATAKTSTENTLPMLILKKMSENGPKKTFTVRTETAGLVSLVSTEVVDPPSTEISAATINASSLDQLPAKSKLSSASYPSLTISQSDIDLLNTALSLQLVQLMLQQVLTVDAVVGQAAPGAFTNILSGDQITLEKAIKPAQLSISQKSCYDLFVSLCSSSNDGDMSAIIEQVAAARNIKATTVCTYLLNAVQLHWPYQIGAFAIAYSLISDVFIVRLFCALLTRHSVGVHSVPVSTRQIMERIDILTRYFTQSGGSGSNIHGTSDANFGNFNSEDNFNDRLTPSKKRLFTPTSVEGSPGGRLKVVPPVPPSFSSVVVGTNDDNFGREDPCFNPADPCEQKSSSISGRSSSTTTFLHPNIMSNSGKELDYWQVRLASLHLTRIFGDGWEHLLATAVVTSTRRSGAASMAPVVEVTTARGAFQPNPGGAPAEDDDASSYLV
jgi:hypothetical protein